MFKTMGYSPGFLLEIGNFRPLRIHPKSTQKVAQAVTNHFRTVLEAFQRVWSDFQNLPKLAMFKTMGYSPGLLLEIGQFSTSTNFDPQDLPRIHPKSTQTVAQAVTNHFRTVLEAFQRVWSDFQDLPKSAMFKTMGYSPGLLLEIGRFSRNRPIFDQFSLNRHKQSQAVTNRFRTVLEALPESLERFPGLARPCSKPWAIAQAFCSKSADFRPLRIHPKLTQKVAQAVTNHFRTVLEAFQRVWSDFQDFAKSAMFKTMGYSPGFLLEIGEFSTPTNSP